MSSQHSITKPFLKWAGGKSKLLSEIEQVIDKSVYKNSITTYVEPFVGGGAMLFFMLRKFPTIERAIINDINEELINTYRVVQQHPAKLIRHLTNIQIEYRKLICDDDQRKFYEERRSEFNDTIEDDIARAGNLIFLNRTCFNGLYRVNKKGKFNVPFGRYNNPLICDSVTIMADSAALKNVEILCGDFTQTLSYANSGSLFYFDPPYKPNK